MSAAPDEPPVIGDPLAQLERAFIDEFLRKRGYEPASVRDLPDEQRAALMKEASKYAAVRLTEVEARAHFVADIHAGHD